jgi:TRAP-type C4-dicarboxylate transport system substrate-binding protein
MSILRINIADDPYAAGHATYGKLPKEYRELFLLGMKEAAGEAEDAAKLTPKFERARERRAALERERTGT